MITRNEHYRDNRGEYRWTAYASNGEAIGVSSEGYSDLADCLHAIVLMQGSNSAEVVVRRELSPSALAAYALSGGAPRSALARLLQHSQGRAEDTILGAALSKARTR
jgi:uncharacterized protein